MGAGVRCPEMERGEVGKGWRVEMGRGREIGSEMERREVEEREELGRSV